MTSKAGMIIYPFRIVILLELNNMDYIFKNWTELFCFWMVFVSELWGRSHRPAPFSFVYSWLWSLWIVGYDLTCGHSALTMCKRSFFFHAPAHTTTASGDCNKKLEDRRWNKKGDPPGWNMMNKSLRTNYPLFLLLDCDRAQFLELSRF